MPDCCCNINIISCLLSLRQTNLHGGSGGDELNQWLLIRSRFCVFRSTCTILSLSEDGCLQASQSWIVSVQLSHITEQKVGACVKVFFFFFLSRVKVSSVEFWHGGLGWFQSQQKIMLPAGQKWYWRDDIRTFFSLGFLLCICVWGISESMSNLFLNLTFIKSVFEKFTFNFLLYMNFLWEVITISGCEDLCWACCELWRGRPYLKQLKGLCEITSCRFVFDVRITYELLYSLKKAVSHFCACVDVPTTSQFIFNPVVIYLGVCFLGAGSSLLSWNLSLYFPPVPSPGGLGERKYGAHIYRRHHSVVPHSMKITVLYPPTLLEKSTQKDSESLKLVHGVRVRVLVLNHQFMSYLSNRLCFIKAVKFASISNEKMH